MKRLIFSIGVSLALMALMVGPVAASPHVPYPPSLVADLDGDGDLERVLQVNSADLGPTEPLFQAIDLDDDGDPDLMRVLGGPERLCNLDQDAMPEAVIQDSRLLQPWAAYAMDRNDEQLALVFVRGQVMACITNTDLGHSVLIGRDPLFTGTVDIDGDGTVDIVWWDPPMSAGASSSA